MPHDSCRVLLLYEPLNGWLELCRVVRRVDALAYGNNTKRSGALYSNKRTVRTDDEANLLIAPRPCFGDTFIGVRDSLLHIKPM